MAAPRLPFLWPVLFRATEAHPPTLRSARAAARYRAYHATSRRRQQELVPQRYGSANEPPPHLSGGKGLGPSTQEYMEQQPKLPKIGSALQKDGEVEVREERAEASGVAQDANRERAKEPTTIDGGAIGATATPMSGDPMLDASSPPVPSDPIGQQSEADVKSPVENLLSSVPGPDPPQPAIEQLDHTFDEHAPPLKAPHLDPPRYIHHFDTYSLVNHLTSSGWSTPHATSAMKAVRLMLADNMELAKAALVSKSMVENETYLFRAACAELKTEVQGRRRAEQEKMRAERTHLQHEVDILSQRIGQEAGALKDDLKGMFDDRKMGVRNEQRGMESKVQQLNYKITVSLQADARSEVEGLRWVMTRRVIITLAAIVVMVIGGLRLAANAIHERELEEKRRKNQRSGGTQTEERGGGSDYGAGIRDMGVGGQMSLKEGENPAFVSLG
ncbi:hypothetical protein LTR53_012914 [Teratosphaeriaceae sp. CCFEE 6253]|nr:hypothetical protein LTR53_012914 [Teratosphaeriaceae sp. CCFEE 6253]